MELRFWMKMDGRSPSFSGTLVNQRKRGTTSGLTRTPGFRKQLQELTTMRLFVAFTAFIRIDILELMYIKLSQLR